MVPRKAALVLMAASLGSCAPQPTGQQLGAPLTPGPRLVPLAMARDSTPGFSGVCYLENRAVAFTFKGYSGPNRLCSASCAFVDGNGAVQTARTAPSGIRPAVASANGTEFSGVASGNGSSTADATAAVRLVESSGTGNCQILY